MSDVNHKEAALEELAEARRIGGVRADINAVLLTKAQLHATLYVGDQIASLVEKTEGVANVLDYIDTKLERIHRDGMR